MYSYYYLNISIIYLTDIPDANEFMDDKNKHLLLWEKVKE